MRTPPQNKQNLLLTSTQYTNQLILNKIKATEFFHYSPFTSTQPQLFKEGSPIFIWDTHSCCFFMGKTEHAHISGYIRMFEQMPVGQMGKTILTLNSHFLLLFYISRQFQQMEEKISCLENLIDHKDRQLAALPQVGGSKNNFPHIRFFHHLWVSSDALSKNMEYVPPKIAKNMSPYVLHKAKLNGDPPGGWGMPLGSKWSQTWCEISRTQHSTGTRAWQVRSDNHQSTNNKTELTQQIFVF